MLTCFYALCFDYGAFNVVLQLLFEFSLQFSGLPKRIEKMPDLFSFLKYFNLLNKWPNRSDQAVFLYFVLTLVKVNNFCAATQILALVSCTYMETMAPTHNMWVIQDWILLLGLNIITKASRFSFCVFQRVVCFLLPSRLMREDVQCSVSSRHAQ